MDLKVNRRRNINSQSKGFIPAPYRRTGTDGGQAGDADTCSVSIYPNYGFPYVLIQLMHDGGAKDADGLWICTDGDWHTDFSHCVGILDDRVVTVAEDMEEE